MSAVKSLDASAKSLDASAKYFGRVGEIIWTPRLAELVTLPTRPGTIGITEKEAALKRWMVAGPEISRLLSEYEEDHTYRRVDDDRHHEQIPNKQKKLALNTKTVMEEIEDLGNPFVDRLGDIGH